MNDNIINLLNLQDENLIIKNIYIENSTKVIEVEKRLEPQFCPICNCRMHSKGIYKRTINHPILQDGYKAIIILYQRRWKCINEVCAYEINDSFSFIQKRKHSTNMTPYMILYELKDISKTAVDVANKFFVSDTYVHYLVLQYLDLKRLKLPKILSVDEVYLNIDDKNKYALVLMDFITGEIIDILPNRLDDTVTRYFNSIDKDERNQVEYLICDMYNPYINFTKRFFTKAVPIIDSFHVIQSINRKIAQYINKVKKRYQERDDKLLEEKNQKTNHDYKSSVVSNEVYLLNNYRWVLLKNQDNINHSPYRKYNRKLRKYMDTYDYERAFLDLDKHFPRIRELKEKYIHFNNSTEQDKTILSKQLDELILEYSKCELKVFREFSETLKKHKTEIINSFTRISIPKENSKDMIIKRLSNGPMEGYNRFPKDYKRNSRGSSNFEYTRTRLLWANRDNASILAVPKDKEKIYKHTTIKRGKYNKKK